MGNNLSLYIIIIAINENAIGGVNQFKAFHARGYPITIPDKCPKKDDLGMITFVITNNNMGPIFTGNPILGPMENEANGFGIKYVVKHNVGIRKIGQYCFILTLAATIHANNTQENPTACEVA